MMGHRISPGSLSAFTVLTGLLGWMAPAGADDDLRNATCQVGGYDAYVGNITGSIANYDVDEAPDGSGEFYDALSLPITTCNLGVVPLPWVVNTPNTPAFAMNLFRVSQERIVQIGQGWVHFGILPLQQATCCACTPVGGAALGGGCSTADSASIHGHQAVAGPKADINPLTGVFPAPASSPPYQAGTTARRLRAKLNELTSTDSYFVEVQVIHPSETPEATRNNVSRRRAVISGTANERTFLLTDTVAAGKPGIGAWSQLAADVVEVEFFDPAIGQAYVSARVTQIAEDLWRYEYAVQNTTVARAFGSISIPRAPQVSVDNFYFHDVDYADGDGLGGVSRDGADWPAVVTTGALEWATTPHALDPNANALRWGTLYNFGFDSNFPPCEGDITLSLFEPGTPASVTVTSVIPGCDAGPPDGDYTSDGVVDVVDYAYFADCMAGPQSSPAPVLQGSSAAACLATFDFNTDGDVDSQDYATFAGL